MHRRSSVASHTGQVVPVDPASFKRRPRRIQPGVRLPAVAHLRIKQHTRTFRLSTTSTQRPVARHLLLLRHDPSGMSPPDSVMPRLVATPANCLEVYPNACRQPHTPLTSNAPSSAVAPTRYASPRLCPTTPGSRIAPATGELPHSMAGQRTGAQARSCPRTQVSTIPSALQCSLHGNVLRHGSRRHRKKLIPIHGAFGHLQSPSGNQALLPLPTRTLPKGKNARHGNVAIPHHYLFAVAHTLQIGA